MESTAQQTELIVLSWSTLTAYYVIEGDACKFMFVATKHGAERDATLDPHHGHVAHSISEPCIPQCPLYVPRDGVCQEHSE